MRATDKEVIIVGAGLAGLACARWLQEAEIPFLILEADARVGGRLKTDRIDGFIQWALLSGRQAAEQIIEELG